MRNPWSGRNIRGNDCQECGSRCSHHVVASCGGRNPSVVSDAVATRLLDTLLFLSALGSLTAALLSVLWLVVLVLTLLLLSVLWLVVLVLTLLLLSVLLLVVLLCLLLLSLLLLLFVLAAVAARVVADCSGRAAAVAEHVAARVWLARAYSLAAGDGLVFGPADRAVREQVQRFREAKTEWLCW